jgi:hypothetical protein
MIGLLIFGGIAALIGVIITLTNLKNMRRRRRIIDTPTSTIAQAPGNGLVEIKGRIVAGTEGVLQAPFSGRYGVWVRVVVQEYRRSGRSGYWATVVDETDFRPFFVEDGSGQRARIVPTGASVILDQQNVGSSGTFNDPPPHLQSFLASRGLSAQSWLGFNKSMRYNEEVLGANDPLYAIGPSSREPGPPVQDAYGRVAPGSQLVMYAGQGDALELILTNKTEEQLVSKLLWGFVGGLITLGIGVLLCFGAVVVWFFENFEF